MILLDTNVVSEPLRPAPDPAVLQWLDVQDPRTLFLSSIAQAELLAGIALLPAGRRRNRLADAIQQRVLPLFEGRLLSFDSQAAAAYAQIAASSRSAGAPMAFADAAIAAIALAHGMALATRNLDDFRTTGIELINPWG